MPSTAKIVLVDFDNTIADLDLGCEMRWRELYPTRSVVLEAQRTTFKIEDNYPPEFKQDLRAIIGADGFIAGLSPRDGAIRALQEMLAAGHEVFICTSPLSKFIPNVPEKYLWVEKYLGEEWAKRRIIISKYKTLIAGDILIDDNPGEITGKRVPQWNRVVYDRTYNQQATGRRLTHWGNWRTQLEGLL